MRAKQFIPNDSDSMHESVAGPEKCWPGHRKVGTQPGTGKNAGKRVNDCEKIKKEGVAEDDYVRTKGPNPLRIPGNMAAPQWNEPAWSFQEIAEKLGIPTAALNLLAFQTIGGFPDAVTGLAARHGSKKYYKRSEIKRWVNANQVREKLAAFKSKKNVAEGLAEDAARAEAQAAYMQGECMILAVAINQLNPKRYPIGYIWEYNTSAGAPDVQLDDDEWDDLTPQEQQEISKDISRHSVVHAYVRDRDTGEYIDARGRHKTLPNLWGRMGQTRFDEFPGTARELIDITAHGDWDEVGEKVDFKRGQPAFDSLSGPAGVKRAQEYAVKYLGVEGPSTPGVEGSKNKLRIGNIVRAVDDGKRVQGEVIGISSDYKEVELWLSGVNDFNPISVNVRDIESVSEQGVAEGEKIGNMDADDFDAAMARLKKLAGAGPMKTVYDPERRVYRNMPTAQQPAKQPKK